MKELIERVDIKVEWEDIRQDIDALYEVEVMHEGKRYLLRSPLQGVWEGTEGGRCSCSCLCDRNQNHGAMFVFKG